MNDTMYIRPVYHELRRRLHEPRRFIQILAGPRQTGKTTVARQTLADWGTRGHYATADEPMIRDRAWIEEQWEIARRIVRLNHTRRKGLLILDEVHKIPAWSEVVKRLWDEDTFKGLNLQVVALGSSPLLVQRGLTESLAGRFEILPVTHWPFSEMQEAFHWDLDRYLVFGGYPGAAEFIREPTRWLRYILESLIETSISRDVLLMTRVDKPALLRRLLELGCSYSGQVLSYQKMLGQLQDAGNTTTLAHYVHLLEGAGLLTGLNKYSGRTLRQRASSPKLLVLNTALMTAMTRLGVDEAKADSEYWGRLVESAVGAHLAGGVRRTELQLFYWREGNREVDYVIQRGRSLIAIEVKSGRRRLALPGMDAFSRAYPCKKMLLVGAQGFSLEEFLATPPEELFRD